MGHRFYAKDCRNYEQEPYPSELELGKKNYFEDEKLNDNFFNLLNNNRSALEQGMELVPNKPFKFPRIFADEQNVSLGVVNIIDYYLYKKGDPATYEEFNASKRDGVPVGLETTHAVVKKAVHDYFAPNRDVPVLFVSPMVDRYLCFDEDVEDRWGAQNKMASYNAGVVVINMLEHIFTKYNFNK